MRSKNIKSDIKLSLGSMQFKIRKHTHTNTHTHEHTELNVGRVKCYRTNI